MKNKSFGLTDSILKQLIDAFKSEQAVEKIKIFGSRAMGNYKPGSDIDIALFGNLTEKDRERIFIKLNEHTNIPYKIDLVLYNDNTSPELKRHIDEFGKALILYY